MTERSHIYPNVLCATPFYESAPNPNVFCAMIFRLLSGQRERWWSPQGLDFPKLILSFMFPSLCSARQWSITGRPPLIRQALSANPNHCCSANRSVYHLQ